MTAIDANQVSPSSDLLAEDMSPADADALSAALQTVEANSGQSITRSMAPQVDPAMSAKKRGTARSQNYGLGGGSQLKMFSSGSNSANATVKEGVSESKSSSPEQDMVQAANSKLDLNNTFDVPEHGSGRSQRRMW